MLRHLLQRLDHHALRSAILADAAETRYRADRTRWQHQMNSARQDLAFLKRYGTPEELACGQRHLWAVRAERPRRRDAVPMPDWMRRLLSTLRP